MKTKSTIPSRPERSPHFQVSIRAEQRGWIQERLQELNLTFEQYLNRLVIEDLFLSLRARLILLVADGQSGTIDRGGSIWAALSER